ncbi:MAG: NmrA family NAD(P)-binding protein [Candidatus Izemoplasma sp.]|nr:NmrA family NAD(P)-binding protein [Candidatus Izemoplasma sp.]
MILIIGGTGTVGKHVVAFLKSKNLAYKLGLYHSHKNDDKQVPIVPFDFDDQSTYDDALKEVDDVFFIRPPQIGDPKAFYPFIDAMKQREIKHVVFLSLMGVEKNPIPPHGKIEKYIKKQLIPYTFIRPSFFMENLITPHGKDIKETDCIVIPAKNAKTSFISGKDIGEVIGTIFLEPQKHANKAYTLTGKEALTYHQVADLFTDGLGRQIRYTSPNFLRYYRHMRTRHFDRKYIIVTIFLYIMTRLNTASDVTNTVNSLLKKDPETMKAFIERHQEVWQ